MSESYSSIVTAIEASGESAKYEEVKKKFLDHDGWRKSKMIGESSTEDNMKVALFGFKR